MDNNSLVFGTLAADITAEKAVRMTPENLAPEVKLPLSPKAEQKNFRGGLTDHAKANADRKKARGMTKKQREANPLLSDNPKDRQAAIQSDTEKFIENGGRVQEIASRNESAPLPEHHVASKSNTNHKGAPQRQRQLQYGSHPEETFSNTPIACKY